VKFEIGQEEYDQTLMSETDLKLELLKFRADCAIRQDEREDDLFNTLDVKTSIFLAMVPLLGGWTTELFKWGLPPTLWRLQGISLVALFSASVCAFAELWPRTFGAAPTPSEFQVWEKDREKVLEEYKDPDRHMLEDLIRARTLGANERAESNIGANTTKAACMRWTFWSLLVSFLMNLATLLIRIW
jgi:hypothetical protein